MKSEYYDILAKASRARSEAWITGLWQVQGAQPHHFRDMVRLDVQYIHGWSLWTDFQASCSDSLDSDQM